MASTLVYSSFEADIVPAPFGFSLGGDAYTGKLWAVNLRLHVSRVVGGQTCTAYSPPVTVKKVTAVDP